MTDAVRDLDEKTLINIRPSVRDVCETSYSMGAKEFYQIAFEAGRKEAIEEAIEIVRSVDPAFMIQELEKLKR